MITRLKWKQWVGNKRVRQAAMTAIWLVLLFAVAIPSWRGVVLRNDEIAQLEEHLSILDNWTVAGMWLAPSVNERTLPVNAAFSRLYPPHRHREILFLDLARVADESGVEDFELSEANEMGMASNDVWSDGTTMAASEEEGPPPGDGIGLAQELEPVMALEVPSVDLATYRVNTHFSGDYRRAAHFLSGLGKIERAIKVHSLVVRPERDGIQVDMELDIYVSQTTES